LNERVQAPDYQTDNHCKQNDREEHNKRDAYPGWNAVLLQVEDKGRDEHRQKNTDGEWHQDGAPHFEARDHDEESSCCDQHIAAWLGDAWITATRRLGTKAEHRQWA